MRYPYFDSSYLPPVRGEFVAWCDAMGTGRSLGRSIHQAANSVFKLHAAFAAAQAELPRTRFYAVMDGVYVTASSRDDMVWVLREAFSLLATEFVRKPGTRHMHMIRAGLAYGPALHGADIPENAFFGADHEQVAVLRDSAAAAALTRVRGQVLLSPAMVHAYTAERSAPPFGVYVHESAKTIPNLVPGSGGGFISSLWQWWLTDSDARDIAAAVYDQILFYLSKAETHSVGMDYPIESIRRHRVLAVEYFGGLALPPDAAPEVGA